MKNQLNREEESLSKPPLLPSCARPSAPGGSRVKGPFAGLQAFVDEFRPCDERLADRRGDLLELSHSIHAEPELAFNEHRSCAKTQALVAERGEQPPLGSLIEWYKNPENPRVFFGRSREIAAAARVILRVTNCSGRRSDSWL